MLGPPMLKWAAPRLRIPWQARLFHPSGRKLHSGPSDVKTQLTRLRDLIHAVSPVNSAKDKQRVIAQYPDLRDVLEKVCDPRLRTHLSSASLTKYLWATAMDPPNRNLSSPDSLVSLLGILDSRQHTGNAAKALVAGFLESNGILEPQADELLGVFHRLLDRNLAAGFGADTLKGVFWDGSSTAQPASSSPAASSTRSSASLPSGGRPVLDCALGKTIEPPFRDLQKHGKWYISRKLDGVRCLAFLDFLVPPNDSAISLLGMQFLSRSGNSFGSLGRLQEQLQKLSEFPELGNWLHRDSQVVSETREGVVKRLVLDGEVCVMRPREGAAEGTCHSDNLVEDFPSTVSEIRRGGGWTIQHPAYFLFDVLSWGEVYAGKKASPHGKTFGQRIEDMEQLSTWLEAHLAAEDVEVHFVRRLEQREMTGLEQVDEMVGRAAEEGWEGLIFRADKAYKGGRSTDIRKFKKWQDAEYTVTSIETGVMRLAVDGVFGMHEACANVWIEHQDTPVSVGSGFSVDQRLRYAQDPSLIIGKQVTVEYFSESKALGRPGAKSLRFPRIKQVWEEGRRDI